MALGSDTSSNASGLRYMGEDERTKIREEIRRVRPFDLTRKKMEFFNKMPGSVYSGLTWSRVEKFLERNKTNFNRKYPHKNVI